MDERDFELIPGLFLETIVDARMIALRLLGWKDESASEYLVNNQLNNGLAKGTLNNRLRSALAEVRQHLWDDGATPAHYAMSEVASLLNRVGIEDDILALSARDDQIKSTDQGIILLLMHLFAHGTPRGGARDVPHLLQRIRAPGVSLFGTGQPGTEFGYPDEIVLEWQDNPNHHAYSPHARDTELKEAFRRIEGTPARNRIFRPDSKELEATMYDIARKIWDQAHADGRTLHNRPREIGTRNSPKGRIRKTPHYQRPMRVRLVDWVNRPYEKAPNPEKSRLHLRVNQAWYFQSLGTNHGLHEWRARSRVYAEYPIDAVEREPDGIRALGRSNLANLLSVNTTALTKDGHVLVQNRSSKNATALWPLQCSGAGFIDLDDTYASNRSVPNAFMAAARELNEEMNLIGLSANPERIEILALCREFARHNEPGLVGIFRLDVGSSDLQLATLRSDEVDSFTMWPLKPRDFFQTLKLDLDKNGLADSWPDRPWDRFVPLGALSIIFAMIHEFGEDEIIAAWDNVSNEA